MMKYLKGIVTLEDLKKAYKEYALQLHPDRPNGSNEEMKILNNEYDILFERVKHIHKNKDGEVYEKPVDEEVNEFKDIIDELLKYHGVHIEVIGSFIWLSGNTKPYKEALKKLGFRWHTKKNNWYKAPKGYRKANKKKQYTMNEIRGMFGVSYEDENDEKQGYIA